VRPFRILLATARALVHRNVIAGEIRDEMQFHVDMRSRDYERGGLGSVDARRAAVRRFGNLAVMRDRGYDVRGGGVMETILQDARYGVRLLARRPGFSLVAIGTLALGVGVATALFSVIDAALLRPLPYPHPEQLVTVSVEETGGSDGPSRYGPSLADIRAWRVLPGVFSHVGMGRVSGFMPPIVETDAPRRLTVATASEDFLETYGIAPIVGRGIQAADTREGAPAVALLGHAFWQTEFGGDPHVLGRVIRIQREPVTIVGVLPAGFYNETAVWQASQWSEIMLHRRGSGTPVVARLRPGVTLDQAAKDLAPATVASTMMGPVPKPVRVVLQSMYDDETSGFGSTVRTLAWAVGLIVLIACVNVAGLLLARGATRHVELAIRASIGAGRGRLVRQLLTESLMLALAGGLLGVLLAYVFLDSLVALIPLSLPANSPATINATVLAFALGLTAMTALLFGLAPALTLSRTRQNINTALAAGGRGIGAPLSRRGGQWLIGIEVALALVLMSGAGLVVRSFTKLVSVDPGFDAAGVLTFEVEPLDQTAAVRGPYYAALTTAIRAMPEVAAAGAIDQPALTGGGTYWFPRADNGADVEGPRHTVLPGYFEAMGIRPIAGRLPIDADRAADDAAVVNTTMSLKYFGGQAVGHVVRERMPAASQGKTPRAFRIVGVVPNIRHGGPQGRVQSETYILPDPRADADVATLAMVMRLRDGATISLDRLKRVAESPGPKVLMGRMRSAADLLGEQVARPRHRMLLLALLGGCGLLLTLVGIFSMTAYAVARRTREIGVRMAFGARPVDVVRAVVRDAVWPVALGLAVGLAGAWFATRVIASFLFQTTPHDPATLASVVVLLGAAACLAAWIPARRAASVDPVRALRSE
jgi:predicted permease